jgi:hypothetical protein
MVVSIYIYIYSGLYGVYIYIESSHFSRVFNYHTTSMNQTMEVADLLIILVHAFAAILSKNTKKGTLTLGGAPVR